MKINDIFSISGKIALVTGGSRGIGEMICRGFLANGVKVYITARKANACNDMAKKLSDEYNAECISIPEDLSTVEGIDNLVNIIKKKENNIDILVNNAGAVWAEPFSDFSEVGWDKIMDINVKSIFFLTQKLYKLLKTNASKETPQE